MAGNADFINILREIRGSAAPGEQSTDGIWYELTIADKAGNPGIYGDMLAKYEVFRDNADNIEIIRTIQAEIAAVAAISDAVIAVDANEANINTVADNIVDVQNAEENAIIAKEEAWRAEAERLTAKSYATESEDVYVKSYTSNNDGTFTMTDTMDYSSYHWERKATSIFIDGIIDDDIVSEEKVYSNSKVVELLEGKLNDNNGVIDLGSITDIIE